MDQNDNIPLEEQPNVKGTSMPQNQVSFPDAQNQFFSVNGIPTNRGINEQRIPHGQMYGYAPQDIPTQPLDVENWHQNPNFPQNTAIYNGGLIQGATQNTQTQTTENFNYDYISSPARVAVYDNLKTTPRVIQIPGGPTHQYIEQIASTTYQNAKDAGGLIPYTVIREVSENFIHANFKEVVVSILDKGNTIRFSDQGPGIHQKELAQQPGFTSAKEPMKRYIRGVGSGFPIVKDYLDISHGYIKIEDNVNSGSVVTISLVPQKQEEDKNKEIIIPTLTENEQVIIKALLPQNVMGVTEMNHATGIAVASIHTAFSKMEEKGLVEKVNKKRKLTDFGKQIALSL